MPKVSVIVPVYNVEKYLNRSLDCLVNQTLKDIEIILINDCSPDNSLKIMQEYAAKDERIKIVDLENNQGAAVARNKGLDIATGEYLGFIDPDDAIDLNYYEELYKAAKEGDYDIVKCPKKNFELDGSRFISPLHAELKRTNNRYLFSFEWTTAVYKHSVVKEKGIRFPEECRKAQDVVFLYRFIYNSKTFHMIDNVYYYHHKREGSLNAKKIPLSSIKSALTAIYLMIDELNKTELFDKNKDLYMQLFWKHHKVIFYTLSQCQSNKAKEFCTKAFIDYFYLCKDVEEYEKKYFGYVWMLKYIKAKDYRMLAKYFKAIKDGCLEDKPLLWHQKFFLIKNDIRGKYKKIVYILGIKLSIKYSHIDNLERKILSMQKEIRSVKRKHMYDTFKYCSIEKREECLKDWYFERMKEPLNLFEPKTYNEKIQWMKLYDSTPIKTKLADKYQVREYVKDKIGEEYLIPLLGVWDKFEDIDFDKLPQQFVLKCNHGCGCNIIVKDKQNFDKEKASKQINEWMNINYAYLGFELHYSDIPRKIIAEEFIQNAENELYDYKVWCFNGKAHYIQFLSERNTDGLKMAFYDREWNKQRFLYSVPMDKKVNKKPEKLELLLELAEKLSAGFNHVRVDFYITNDGRIYFGEMTFTSCNGTARWEPKEADLMLGNLIELSKVGVSKTC